MLSRLKPAKGNPRRRNRPSAAIERSGRGPGARSSRQIHHPPSDAWARLTNASAARRPGTPHPAARTGHAVARVSAPVSAARAATRPIRSRALKTATTLRAAAPVTSDSPPIQAVVCVDGE